MPPTSRRSTRPLAALAAALLAVTLVPGPSSAQSLDDARRERGQLQTRLDAAAQDLGDVQDRVARLESDTDDLEAEVGALRAAVAELEDGVQAQVVEMFKRGSSRDPVTVFLTSDDPQEVVLRSQALQRAVTGDVGELEALLADRTRLAAAEARLAERREELDEARAAQEQVTADLEADLAEAQRLEERLEREERERREREERERREREERERRERAAAQAAEDEAAASAAAPEAPSDDADTDDAGADDGSSSGGSGGSGGGSSGGGATDVGGSGMACPVGQPLSFSDTWGAPRSGGRAHRGTDMLAPYGTPVYAIVSGSWDIQSPGPSAGLWAILRGDDGNHYWYLHLQSHTVGGGRVEAGQQVATNGDTGNATGTPHVHFELHPGGGGAINPYPTLAGVC